MSNYHDEIMNISLPNDLAIRHIVSDSQTGGTGVVYAYKCGQRDARHVAAEIAAQADARIRELEAKLRAYQETAEHYCAVDTPISADGIRAHIATIEAQLAAANHRVAELEAERTVAPLANGSERRG